MQNHDNFLQLIKFALAEDVGTGDLTAQLIPSDKVITAQLITREPMIICGKAYFNEVFLQCDPSVQIVWNFNDKIFVQSNSYLCTVTGNARNILTAERTALNFLQTLSGTATTVSHFVDLIKHTQTKLLDTRKTIPGLRQAQKYAVICGGGVNHRIGLYDAFLIKENHIVASGSITNAVAKARSLNSKFLIEVEVENFEELSEAIENKVPRILLDNFELSELKKAVQFTAKRAELEASGNITEKNIGLIAETGVDYISIGSLTKNIRAIDLSMRFFNT